jgi:hypothetical protein
MLCTLPLDSSVHESIHYSLAHYLRLAIQSFSQDQQSRKSRSPLPYSSLTDSIRVLLRVDLRMVDSCCDLCPSVVFGSEIQNRPHGHVKIGFAGKRMRERLLQSPTSKSRPGGNLYPMRSIECEIGYWMQFHIDFQTYLIKLQNVGLNQTLCLLQVSLHLPFLRHCRCLP